MNSHPAKERKAEVPLIAHVIFRLDVGGLENGLVNLINQTPPGIFRHAIICVTHATDFRRRIEADDVAIIELNKKPGTDLAVYWRFWRAVRRLKPDVIHTRNLNTIEFQPFAFLAGVRARIHGEHGWDVHDIDGTSRKYRVLRKMLRPFVDRFIAVSQGLHDYLTAAVRVSPDRISLIYNGVDLTKFSPRETSDGKGGQTCAATVRPIVIGTIGRMKEVKNQRLLVQAFVGLIRSHPDQRSRIRLLMAGDGPLRDELMNDLSNAGLVEFCSFPGACDNVAELLRDIDIFVLPSRNEGISNTILEAMGTALPVVATRVGGTPEIVSDSVTGVLVDDGDVSALVSALLRYIENPELRRRHGTAGRARAQANFSLGAMVARYLDVYRQCLN